jgi:hypothetical protein
MHIDATLATSRYSLPASYPPLSAAFAEFVTISSGTQEGLSVQSAERAPSVARKDFGGHAGAYSDRLLPDHSFH